MRNKQNKPHWLDRSLMNGPYLTLCLNEEEFRRELKRLKIREHVDFLASTHANATVHFLISPMGNKCCIVCLGDTKDYDPIQICAMLVHEAVHIFDEHCRGIGEENPSSEFKAYSIQAISQSLMFEYARRIEA